jgi:hypothetical protein
MELKQEDIKRLEGILFELDRGGIADVFDRRFLHQLKDKAKAQLEQSQSDYTDGKNYLTLEELLTDLGYDYNNYIVTKELVKTK